MLFLDIFHMEVGGQVQLPWSCWGVGVLCHFCFFFSASRVFCTIAASQFRTRSSKGCGPERLDLWDDPRSEMNRSFQTVEPGRDVRSSGFICNECFRVYHWEEAVNRYCWMQQSNFSHHTLGWSAGPGLQLEPCTLCLSFGYIRLLQQHLNGRQCTLKGWKNN